MPRSIEELSDALSRDRVWRLKEISSVLKLAQVPKLGIVESEFYCRGGAALFYAHWEGFIKRAATTFLQYVAYQRPALQEMADFLLCSFVQERIADLAQRDRVLEVAGMLLRSSATKPKMNYKGVIDTESNLPSNVFRRILEQVGVPVDEFETRLRAIDSKILANRHPIAHGAKGDVDIETLVEIGTLVIELSAAFKDALENAAVQKSYLRN